MQLDHKFSEIIIHLLNFHPSLAVNSFQMLILATFSHSLVLIAFAIPLIQGQQAADPNPVTGMKNAKTSKLSHLGYQIRDSNSMPNIFHLPYEKLANPLSTFLSWISSNYKSDQNVRTYDLLYNKESESSPDENPAAERRFDLFSGFQFPKLSKLSNTMARAYTSVPQYSGHTMPKTPQFDVVFPRHLPKEKQGISAVTKKLIQKYAPNPKVHFYQSYYPQQYQVPVPFIVKDGAVFTPNAALGGRSAASFGRSMNSNQASYSSKQYGNSYKHNINLPGNSIGHSGGRLEQVSEALPSTRQIGYSKSIPLNNAYSKPLPSPSSSSVVTGRGNSNFKKNWEPSDSGRPYTGKAQYSTIDNSADPMSPSASMYSFKSSSQFSPSKNLIKISELSK